MIHAAPATTGQQPMPPACAFSVQDFARRVSQLAPGMVLIDALSLRRLLKTSERLFGVNGPANEASGACLERNALLTSVRDIASAPVLPAPLPAWVVLLAWPPPRRAWGRRDPVAEARRLLQEAFRQLLRRQLLEQPFTAEQEKAIQEELGPAAWAEAVAVLKRDGRLKAPFTAAAAAREYCAEALVQQRLGAGLAVWFPGSPPRILDRLEPLAQPSWLLVERLARELAHAQEETQVSQLARFRPEAVVAGDAHAAAAKARAAGNHVRALLLTAAAQGHGDPADLAALVGRLGRALEESRIDDQAWKSWLEAFVLPASRGRWSQEARFLYDLQKVCVDRESPIYAVDVVGRLRFGDRLPVRRALPLAPGVLVLKHLRKALSRLPKCLLSDATRGDVRNALVGIIDAEEQRLRRQLKPLVEDILPAVGLAPRNLPQRLAQRKFAAELMDQVIAKGRFDFQGLRDALSRNEMKLGDLAGPGEFFRGDALIRADRELAVRLDGVYHPGEVYLRWFQRFSALGFGTPLGRFITKYVALPFGGALVIMEFIQHYLRMLTQWLFAYDLDMVSALNVVLVGIYFLGLLHAPRVRALSWEAVKAVGLCFWRLFVTLPWLIYTQTPLRALLRSPPVRLLARLTLPALALAATTSLTLFLYDVPREPNLNLSGAVLIIALVLLNTRQGRRLEERLIDVLLSTWDVLRVDFLPGLIRFIADLFNSLLEATERGLYAVDEWLRFRPGASRWSVLTKGALGLVWFLATYIFRFVLRLLVEPQVNPLKHFPVVTVSHKFLLPTIPHFARMLETVMPGQAVYATTLATAIIFGIPGVFGFLVWELKENWRLYDANRDPNLRPVPVGHHGESVRRLLRPGFYSGTIPTQYARLRAVAEGYARPALRAKARRELAHARHALEHLVEREFLAFLAADPRWADVPKVSGVELTTNWAGITASAARSGEDWRVEVVWLDDRLRGSFHLPKTLAAELGEEQRRVLALALAGLWARMGIAQPAPPTLPWTDWVKAWEQADGGALARAALPLLTVPGEGTAKGA
jgi:hypothetical protein